MPAAPLLYTYRRCPYAMRARMALLQTGIAFDAFEIVLRDKPAALLALSPKGTVPVLHLPDGRVWEQSLDIVRWAFEHTGDTQGWWARAQTADNLVLLSACDGPFKHHLDRFKYPERFAAREDAATDPNTAASMKAAARRQHHDQAVTTLLLPLNAQLQATGQLGGSAPCAADTAIFPFVRQFAAVDPAGFDALPLPALQGWLRGWQVCPLFQSAMIKLGANGVQPYPRNV